MQKKISSITGRYSLATIGPRGLSAIHRRPFESWQINGKSLPKRREKRQDYFFFLGTFFPFLRALDNPMAIACFLLLTLPPFPFGPLFAVPFLYRRISLFTSLPELLEYFRFFAFLAMIVPWLTAGTIGEGKVGSGVGTAASADTKFGPFSGGREILRIDM